MEKTDTILCACTLHKMILPALSYSILAQSLILFWTKIVFIYSIIAGDVYIAIK